MKNHRELIKEFLLTKPDATMREIADYVSAQKGGSVPAMMGAADAEAAAVIEASDSSLLVPKGIPIPFSPPHDPRPDGKNTDFEKVAKGLEEEVASKDAPMEKDSATAGKVIRRLKKENKTQGKKGRKPGRPRGTTNKKKVGASDIVLRMARAAKAAKARANDPEKIMRRMLGISQLIAELRAEYDLLKKEARVKMDRMSL